MKLKILAYNGWHDEMEASVMPKMKMLNQGQEPFGKRLSRLRKAAGYSQRALAAEVGISYRVVAYYEGETEYPPAHLLPQLAKALGVTADQLLGMEKEKKNGKVRDNRLWRRFAQVEKLSPDQRKPIIQVIDSFLEREKLKKG